MYSKIIQNCDTATGGRKGVSEDPFQEDEEVDVRRKHFQSRRIDSMKEKEQ